MCITVFFIPLFLFYFFLLFLFKVLCTLVARGVLFSASFFSLYSH
jgi:hypothetical protein